MAVLRWKGDRPFWFVDEGKRHQVQWIIDEWWEMGDWWKAGRDRRMLRVWTDRGACMDLECEEGTWRVYRIWD
ncbi:hypothetical protein [Alicyclobacillus fructus]|uniref:hypothetical protein n=1 Tax=Alicyclobacillus fructus TaxID=2816082 RepID=UPI002E2B0126|nr:hypothetical protein [Alicyclobacillus fructus]